MDDIGIVLLENGEAANDGNSKGTLLKGIDGTAEPGRVYDEVIAGRNDGAAPQYVRIIITKYWKDAKGVRGTKLDPSLIQLTYEGNEYNSASWQRNADEHTAESDTYYYSKALDPGDTTEPVIDSFRISDKVISEEAGNIKVTSRKEGDRTIYTYEYIYDGYKACVEADIQSVQTHNGAHAIEGIWGLNNISVSDDGLKVEREE